MNCENIKEKYNRLEGDSFLQNYINQANARYILYNTNEPKVNFPKYSIDDNSLSTLSLEYIRIGCDFFENGCYENAAEALNKGASILEYVYGAQNIEVNGKPLYCLISSMAYYVGFHYSKAFILANKINNSTNISSLLIFFLCRKFKELQKLIDTIVFDEKYSEDYLLQHPDDNPDGKIQEITIARVLNDFLQYYYTGDSSILKDSYGKLCALKEISIENHEPIIWIICRLLLLITEGFEKSSLWNVLGKYFDTNENYPQKYIRSLVYNKHSITELFVSQRNALDKVLNDNVTGNVVSLPTSSGKTRIGEIAIVDCISKHYKSKILYIAPYRSLAYEVENSFDDVFENLSLSVSHLYGGFSFSSIDYESINDSTIIISTPEKVKAILRGSPNSLDDVKLVIIDEGHLFGESRRYIQNEVFYEELRCRIERNGGKFLLLSAVLPNAEDLSQWLSESTDNCFKSNWKPSEERIGTLEWDGTCANIKWKSYDNQRESYNRNFVIKKELPRKPRERKTHYFPDDKNSAIAATAYKLRQLGTVLIFVGRKDSVKSMASHYLRCCETEGIFEHTDKNDWEIYRLACEECFGLDNEWVKYAEYGIFCHNADFPADVRLPLERLMRKEKPRVIIATSTLAQGVNLGVTTVIISSLMQAENKLSKSDFWNIAGRAGRAYTDREGKILIAVENYGQRQKPDNITINNYLDKDTMNRAESGLLLMILKIKQIAEYNNMSFENLLELMSDGKIEEMKGLMRDEIFDNLDCIDDCLLSMHQSFSESMEDDDVRWVDECFSKSLAYIQTKYYQPKISGNEVIKFIKSRVKGLIKIVSTNHINVNSVIASGLPFESDLQINELLPSLANVARLYLTSAKEAQDVLSFVESTENIISEIKLYKETSNIVTCHDEIREMWITGEQLSEILKLDKKANDFIIKHYTFNLPWILNGISKKLKSILLVDESSAFEDLSELVQTGLPNIQSVKVYQSGIKSRVASCEICKQIPGHILDKNISMIKSYIKSNSNEIKSKISQPSGLWIDSLGSVPIDERIVIKAIDSIQIDDITSEDHKMLVPKLIDSMPYLTSIDLSTKYKVDVKYIDWFSNACDIAGIYFIFDRISKKWEMTCFNPYVRISD